MYPIEEKQLRRTFYPVGKGIVMGFYKGQTVNLSGSKYLISSISEYSLPMGQSYSAIYITLPSGEKFMWKKIFHSGVVHEYDVESLL